jgi:two-component system cell cycle sensor histidine kinase/response regulator CckA
MDEQESNDKVHVAGVLDDTVRENLRGFAGRIAHDFNNLLTPLLAYPQLIRADLPADSTGRGLLDVVEDISETMANITRRLAEFAIPRSNGKHWVAVDDVLQEVIASIENSDLATGITIAPIKKSELGVMVSRDVMIDPLKEICTNALESMSGKGVLSTTVDSLVLDEAFPVLGNKIPAGPYARISIHDTGVGMSEEVRDRAFDPFFTTDMQSKARGAGLGLTIALASVRDCGGFILLGDASPDGFTVSVLFPAAQEVAPVLAHDVVPATPTASTAVLKRRVLVVDDEAPIVDLFKLMLESIIPNVEVDTAGNGREALEAFKLHQHSVIVMDLHMPEMDGQSAFAALNKLCAENGWSMPGVVFCTGYAPPDGVKDAIAGDSLHDLLHKPVTTEALVQAVESRLNIESS